MKYVIKYQNGGKTPLVEKLPKNYNQINQNWDKVTKLYNMAKERGISNAKITGILGNISTETGGTFNPETKQQFGGKGRTFMQLEKGTQRHADFLSRVKNPNSFDEQAKYLLDTLEEESQKNSTLIWGRYNNQDKWKADNSGSATKSAELIANLYFRPGKPNMNDRTAAARYIENKLKTTLSEKPDWLPRTYKENPDFVTKFKSGGKWIQKAINPKHKGYCTPMTKSTCTPHRKALAKRFKSGEFKKKEGGILSISNILEKWKK